MLLLRARFGCARRQWFLGTRDTVLTRAQVAQMAGRAGRKGLDASGEAILFAPGNGVQRAKIGALMKVLSCFLGHCKKLGQPVPVQVNDPLCCAVYWRVQGSGFRVSMDIFMKC